MAKNEDLVILEDHFVVRTPGHRRQMRQTKHGPSRERRSYASIANHWTNSRWPPSTSTVWPLFPVHVRCRVRVVQGDFSLIG